jgi:hypothetical protein
MKDPAESKLQRTRQRSLASKRHKFEFFEDSQRAVFPIVRRDTTGVIVLSGTGFFVAPGGIFVTAKHVFEEGEDIDHSNSFEIIQEGVDHVESRLITEVILDANLDIAVGRLESPHEQCASCENHPVVGIMQLDPEIHEVLGSFVFSHTLINPPEELQSDDKTELYQKVKFRSHWEVGLAEEIYEDGLGHVKGRCFGTSVFVEGRASGGPLFNSNGFVIGLNSTGIAEPEGLPHSTATSIRGVYSLEIGGKSITDWRKGLRNDRIAYRKSLT